MDIPDGMGLMRCLYCDETFPTLDAKDGEVWTVGVSLEDIRDHIRLMHPDLSEGIEDTRP